MGIAERWRGIAGRMIPPFKGNLEQKLKELAERFSLEPKILAAYLFGSRARDEERESSDVDIALLTDELSSEEYTTIAKTVAHILGTERVDIVLLNQVSPAFRFRVISEGWGFYHRDAQTENRFELRVMKEYWDTGILRRNQYEILRKEIKSWSLEKKR